MVDTVGLIAAREAAHRLFASAEASALEHPAYSRADFFSETDRSSWSPKDLEDYRTLCAYFTQPRGSLIETILSQNQTSDRVHSTEFIPAVQEFLDTVLEPKSKTAIFAPHTDPIIQLSEHILLGESASSTKAATCPFRDRINLDKALGYFKEPLGGKAKRPESQEEAITHGVTPKKAKEAARRKNILLAALLSEPLQQLSGLIKTLCKDMSSMDRAQQTFIDEGRHRFEIQKANPLDWANITTEGVREQHRNLKRKSDSYRVADTWIKPQRITGDLLGVSHNLALVHHESHRPLALALTKASEIIANLVTFGMADDPSGLAKLFEVLTASGDKIARDSDGLDRCDHTKGTLVEGIISVSQAISILTASGFVDDETGEPVAIKEILEQKESLVMLLAKQSAELLMNMVQPVILRGMGLNAPIRVKRGPNGEVLHLKLPDSYKKYLRTERSERELVSTQGSGKLNKLKGTQWILSHETLLGCPMMQKGFALEKNSDVVQTDPPLIEFISAFLDLTLEMYQRELITTGEQPSA